jgi:3-oxoacyl-[acyl-carrier-protein] synthase I
MSALPLAPVCVAWGAVSALGPSARHTGLYLRAGRNDFSRSPFVDPNGEPIVLSCASTLDKDLVGPARLVALAAGAIEQALAPLAAALSGQRLRACLALPSHYAAGARGALNVEGQEFVARLLECGALPQPLECRSLPLGSAAGAPAIALAAQLLHAREADAVIVCGADSDYDARVLERLLEQDRLLTADNIDGLRPGEAAACLVLVTPYHPLARARGVASVIAQGQGREPHLPGAEQPTMARGFTEALALALAPLRERKRRCAQWYTDITHEEYRVREFQILLARFGDTLAVGTELETPARELGVVGAATLPLYAALVAESWYRDYGTDDHAVCMAASEDGLRGALLLQKLGTKP